MQKKIEKEIKELSDKFETMTDEEFKEGFISYFGEEVWNQEEALSKLLGIQFFIADKLNVEPIPVIVEEIEEDSRLDIKNNCIIISNKLIYDKKESIKCIIHEYRHYMQYCTVAGEVNHPLKEEWKENLKNVYHPTDFNDSDQMTKYYLQPIELDAFAYTKYFFKKYLNEDLICLHEDFEKVIDLYIIKYLEQEN